MGFKDLNLLNIALLAKQVWRIINNLEAMWVKILKGRYFSRGSILETKKGLRVSWAWSSILEGIYFFKEIMMWQVMNGEEMDFWNDKWLSRECLKDIVNEDVEGKARVADYIVREGKWKVEQLKEKIGDEVIKKIEAIPISVNGERDRILWPSVRDEEYSMKTGYHIIKEK